MRPVIILGMHRSGTSCLTGSLEEAGLFLGEVNQKSRCNAKGTRENIAFMHVNDAVLKANDARWDAPPDGLPEWRSQDVSARDELIDGYAGAHSWGFKDPRTLLTFPRWREALPQAHLIASIRDPMAVAQSLNKRNDFPLEKGLALWRSYNERLLAICEEDQVTVINYDWPPAQYEQALRRICRRTGLVSPPGGFRFFEARLRQNAASSPTALPETVRALHRQLRARARTILREAPLRAAECARRDRTFTAHSMRLFPKHKGASAYALTGIAERCDWVLLTDDKHPVSELRRQKKTERPRHVFLSLRSPFDAIKHFETKVLPLLDRPFVLVSGSEDVTLPNQKDQRWRSFTDEERKSLLRLLDHPLLITWFCENLDEAAHTRLRSLPTGMVYADGDPKTRVAPPFCKPMRDRPVRALCGHRVRAGNQWTMRRRVSDIAQSHWQAWCTLLNEEVSEAAYIKAIEQHAFVICVEGGGVDPSPKAWQAILHGAIPIIRRSAVEEAYRELPVAFVEDWSADAINEKRLAAWLQELRGAFEKPALRRETLRRLSLDYWWEKVDRAAASIAA
ncbi:MAG: sulfotransferase [Pseudomonadota bacterium]